MIKKIAWNIFKNTGNIDTFLELKQIEENIKVEANENSKNKWDSDSRKNGSRF